MHVFDRMPIKCTQKVLIRNGHDGALSIAAKTAGGENAGRTK
jgi:hypothetical protein